jgi:Zn ribbon nucleic-acid-binding protein
VSLHRVCCCVENDYWLLVNCSDPSTAISPPRYVYTRCDFYELQTGDSAANCPANWTPDPYIVWNQDPTPCTSAPACGYARRASDYSVAPTQITTDAVTQGLQTTPPLTVSDTCPSVANGPVTLASRDELLAWLDIDDCCSDECGNVAPGTSISCNLLSSDPCTVALSTIAARTQFRWYAPASSAYGSNSPFAGSWIGTVTLGTMPASWTIAADAGGASGNYTLTFTVPYSVEYDVEVECDPYNTSGCGSTPTTQTITFNGSFTLTAGVTGLSALNCATSPFGVGVNMGSSLPSVANVTCGQTSANWSGGLSRSSPDDIGCTTGINFESANYYAFAFKVQEPDLSGYAPVCMVEEYNTTSSPLAYLEIITPLGEETEYC